MFQSERAEEEDDSGQREEDECHPSTSTAAQRGKQEGEAQHLQRTRHKSWKTWTFRE